jgi:hypothetical protein
VKGVWEKERGVDRRVVCSVGHLTLVRTVGTYALRGHVFFLLEQEETLFTSGVARSKMGLESHLTCCLTETDG